MVSIRDTMNALVQVNLTLITVRPDSAAVHQLMQQLQTSASVSNNSLVQMLLTGDPNKVGQVLTSVTQQINDINTQLINETASSLSMILSHRSDRLPTLS